MKTDENLYKLKAHEDEKFPQNRNQKAAVITKTQSKEFN